jgi:hypothetical protein
VITQFFARKQNTHEVKIILHTRSGKQVSKQIFNLVPGDPAMLLLGILGNATRHSLHGKSR